MMRLDVGKTAVVTGAASGIGLGLAERLARAGLNVVLADIEETALRAAAERVEACGVKSLWVLTDVSREEDVNALARRALESFGAVHLVFNNAGVSTLADPWFGPTSAWNWVLGVNLWGVIYGIRAFLPHLVAQGEGHIVNTASIAGLYPGPGAQYDASKHAVVAITEDLYRTVKMAALPVGVSVLCPGWVRTGILDAGRNWPDRLGAPPENSAATTFLRPYVERLIDEGAAPAAVADMIVEAVEGDRFWIFTESQFIEMALERWHSIAERLNPNVETDVPGLPPNSEIAAEIQRLLSSGA
jgi:NAD(P)-dependent dehydrogenase (short-subunit alcohol dehydrogenase family)